MGTEIGSPTGRPWVPVEGVLCPVEIKRARLFGDFLTQASGITDEQDQRVLITYATMVLASIKAEMPLLPTINDHLGVCVQSLESWRPDEELNTPTWRKNFLVYLTENFSLALEKSVAVLNQQSQPPSNDIY